MSQAERSDDPAEREKERAGEPRPQGANRQIRKDWESSSDIIRDVWIYKDSHSAMFHLELENLPSVGFLCTEVPERSWDWLMGSLSSQIARVAEKAYANGMRDAQVAMREALGLND